MPHSPTRPAFQLAPPLQIEPAFDSPAEVRELIAQGAPYKTISAVQKEPPGTRCAPWFRSFWALGGNVLMPGAQAVFHNRHFIDAAKESFSASVVLPLAMMSNLNAPAPKAPPHLDLPYFRGAHQREVPLWMLAPMGYSGLFQRWAIPAASAITWFYGGKDGGFEYWPNGLDNPSRLEQNLGGNRAIVADNEYMYHRVSDIGQREQHLPNNQVNYDAMLHLKKDDWVIEQDGSELASYPPSQMRISILWKAFCFADDEQAQAYRSNTDNLTPAQIVDIFHTELRHRGHQLNTPQTLDGKDKWAETIRQVFHAKTSA